MGNKEPSFGQIVAIVWKVFMAILLIPALILLVYVAAKVIPGSTITIAAIAVLIASGFMYWRLGR